MELKIDRLSKTYANGVHALNNVSLTIAPGMFGLLGPNGAGKSTLMRILATLQEADAGSAHLGDIDVLRDKEAVRRTLGYLPQEFGLYPRATAEELLDHFAVLKGVVDGRERRDTVRSLLEQTNLYEARSRRLGSFSGGMRQRFGIAVALIGNPRLIIVDEPTAGLDPAERVRFLNLLSELGENAVVILSTHIVEDVSDLCSRMAIIRAGQILLEGVPQDAVRDLRGMVWRREVPREELDAFAEAHPVISTTLVAGRTVVNVHGGTPPDPSFEPVEPDLKDVYFTTMRGIGIGPRALPVESARPVAPAEPVMRIEPVDSVASAEFADPLEPMRLEPADPVASAELAEPVEPARAEAVEPMRTEPVEPVAPTGFAEPVEPMRTEPAEPTGPAGQADDDERGERGTFRAPEGP